MALLAERKRKVKFGLDPRNTEWSNDTSKLGQQLMEKMGWEKGKGLGANENGIKEPIKASYKLDTRGLGCTPKAADAWIAHQDDFNDLLKMLNSGNAAASQPESTEHVDGRKRFYGRFARGQVQTLRSTQDLDCIFGRRKHRSTKEDAAESVEPSAEPEARLDQENPSEHGLKTVTSSCSVQEYFAKKMAELQAKKLAKCQTQSFMSNAGSLNETAIDHVGGKNKSAKKDSSNLKTYNNCAPIPDLNNGSEDRREWYVPFLSLDSDPLQRQSENDDPENKRKRKFEALVTQEHGSEVVSKKAKKRYIEESIELDESSKVEVVSQKTKKKKIMEGIELDDESPKPEEVPKKAKKRKIEMGIELDQSLKPENEFKKTKKIVGIELDQLPVPEVSKKVKKKKNENIQLDHSPKPLKPSKKSKKKAVVEDIELVESSKTEEASKKSKEIVEDIELEQSPHPKKAPKKSKRIVSIESNLLPKPEEISKKTKKKKIVENIELHQSPKLEEISKKGKKIKTDESIKVATDSQISRADVSELNKEKEMLNSEQVSDTKLDVQISVDPALTEKRLLRKKSKKKRIKKPKTEKAASSLFPGSNLHEINGYGVLGSSSQAAENTPVVPKKSKKKRKSRFKKVSV